MFILITWCCHWFGAKLLSPGRTYDVMWRKKITFSENAVFRIWLIPRCKFLEKIHLLAIPIFLTPISCGDARFEWWSLITQSIKTRSLFGPAPPRFPTCIAAGNSFDEISGTLETRRCCRIAFAVRTTWVNHFGAMGTYLIGSAILLKNKKWEILAPTESNIKISSTVFDKLPHPQHPHVICD